MRAGSGIHATLVLVAGFCTGAARGDAPFAVEALRVPGRVVEAFAVPAGDGQPRLVVTAIEGQPPEERRFVCIFPPPPLVGGEAAVSEVPSEVVAFDVADVRPEPGLELLLLSARGLEIRNGGRRLAFLPVDPPLPLPERTRQLSRLELLRDWNGDGGRSALLPSLGGALLLPLDGSPVRRLPLPMITAYETMDDARPVYPGYAESRVVWPGLTRGDDDGDGRLDLFALSRFDLWVFRSGPQGLAQKPARRVRFAPFRFEEERRHETNSLRAFARDLDGDGRADLVVHRTEGSLMRSHASTDVYRNPGDGADPTGAAAASLSARGGFGSITLQDLDGDGRVELVQTVVPFGVLQLIRVLARRSVEAKLRVYVFEAPGLGPLRESWSIGLGYPLDFDAGRIQGLLPRVDGDWNGDGRRDLIHGDGPEAVRIRLGGVGELGPRFGPSVARQVLPASDEALVSDLSGDGLDDLVVFDPLDQEGSLYLARNRGILASPEKP